MFISAKYHFCGIVEISCPLKTIYVLGAKVDTNRMNEERFSSVTEIWHKLALFDSKMINWPISLECESCERKFGHHIGTAQCPFDKIMLIDPNVKGRIDPVEMHPDDENRV